MSTQSIASGCGPRIPCLSVASNLGSSRTSSKAGRMLAGQSASCTCPSAPKIWATHTMRNEMTPRVPVWHPQKPEPYQLDIATKMASEGLLGQPAPSVIGRTDARSRGLLRLPTVHGKVKPLRTFFFIVKRLCTRSHDLKDPCAGPRAGTALSWLKSCGGSNRFGSYIPSLKGCLQNPRTLPPIAFLHSWQAFRRKELRSGNWCWEGPLNNSPVLMFVIGIHLLQSLQTRRKVSLLAL